MPPQLVAVPPPVTGLFRVARGIEPFAPPDWAYAHNDGTFGNRFDDPSASAGTPPEDRFRVIYCATSRAGAFGETLAHFRVSLPLLEALENIDDEESVVDALTGAVDPLAPRRGLVKAEWRLARRIGQTVLDPTLRFADIAAIESTQYLRTALAPLANRLDLHDVDLSALTSQHRLLTQHCARHIYDLTNEVGQPLFAGIRYLSRFGPDWECWALFDGRIRHMSGWPGFPSGIAPDDPDLLTVARYFGLAIEVVSGGNTYLRPWAPTPDI